MPAKVAQIVDDIVSPGLVALTPSPDGWLYSPAILRDAAKPALAGEIDRIVHLVDNFKSRCAALGITDLRSENATEALRASFGQEGLDLDSPRSVVMVLSSLLDERVGGLRCDDLVAQAALLRRASTVPFRLRGSRFDHYDILGIQLGPLCQLVRSDALSAERANTRSRRRLRNTLDSGEYVEGAEPSSLLAECASTMSGDVQRLYDELLLNSPPLALHLRNIADWLAGSPAEWTTAAPSGQWLPITALSEAQLKWALVAIELQETSSPWRYDGVDVEDPMETDWYTVSHRWDERQTLFDTPWFVFLDEPDAALHATAQRHAVDGLTRLARRLQVVVIVASHSAEFLNHPEVTPLHVQRDGEGAVTVERMRSLQRARVRELGLAPADLLLLYRCVLVVEGSHDQVVVDALIGELLDSLGVLVLPMRGGRLLATVVDSYFLANLSDVPVIAALDNLDAYRVSAFWEEVAQAAREGAAPSFDEIVKHHFSSKERSEEVFLIDYCRSVVTLGQFARFQVFGFEKPDIPEYLPVDRIVPGARSWDELRAAFAAQKKVRSFKPWLEQVRGVTIDESVLRAAAAAMDSVPDDFLRLLDVCRSTQRRRAD
jgi:hypothetical protein